MAREKAQFTGGKEYDPTDFTNDNLHEKLVDIYLSNFDTKQHPLSPENLGLATKFADDMIDAARPLLHFIQIERQMVCKSDLLKEVDVLIRTAHSKGTNEFRILFDKVSPGIACLMNCLPINVAVASDRQIEIILNGLTLARKTIEKSDFRKPDSESLRKMYITDYISKVYYIFTGNGIKFTCVSDSSAIKTNTLIESVRTTLESIQGFCCAQSTINKWIKEFKKEMGLTRN